MPKRKMWGWRITAIVRGAESRPGTGERRRTWTLQAHDKHEARRVALELWWRKGLVVSRFVSFEAKVVE